MSLFNLYFLTKLYTYTPSKLKKWVLGEPNILHQSGCFTRMWEVTWRVSDCEELVGEVNHTTEYMTDPFSFVDFEWIIL